MITRDLLRTAMRLGRPGVAFGVIFFMGVSPGRSATCDVPSRSYPSIQSAVNVVTCTDIAVASGKFFGDVTISRTLTLRGTSSDTTTVFGRMTVSGSGTVLTLEGLKIAAGPDTSTQGTLEVVTGAQVIPDDVLIVPTDLIFEDGFERGDSTAWSNSVP